MQELCAILSTLDFIKSLQLFLELAHMWARELSTFVLDRSKFRINHLCGTFVAPRLKGKGEALLGVRNTAIMLAARQLVRYVRGCNSGMVRSLQRKLVAGERRWSATAAAGANASASASASAKGRLWGFLTNPFFLKTIKLGRTVVIGVGIYRAGQVAGVSEYMQDPQSVSNTIAQSLVINSGGTGILRRDTAEYKRLNRMVSRILKVCIACVAYMMCNVYRAIHVCLKYHILYCMYTDPYFYLQASVTHLDLKLLHLIETLDRAEIRRLQLEARAKSDTTSAAASKLAEKHKDKSPVKILAKKTGWTVEQEVLADLQKKLLRSGYPDLPRAKKGEVISSLAVPDRLALPTPLLNHKDFTHHKDGVIALMASSDVQYDENMTLGRLKEMEGQLKEEIAFWTSARKSMKGDWEVFVTDSSAANAFVSHLLPRKIFVCSGLITQLNPTDDELGMVLCHEISHFILQHGKQATELDLVINMVRLGMSAVIGFEWFWITDKVTEYVGELMKNSDSRECELEADVLGQQLAADTLGMSMGMGMGMSMGMTTTVRNMSNVASLALASRREGPSDHPASHGSPVSSPIKMR